MPDFFATFRTDHRKYRRYLPRGIRNPRSSLPSYIRLAVLTEMPSSFAARFDDTCSLLLIALISACRSNRSNRSTRRILRPSVSRVNTVRENYFNVDLRNSAWYFLRMNSKHRQYAVSHPCDPAWQTSLGDQERFDEAQERFGEPPSESFLASSELPIDSNPPPAAVGKEQTP